jgi:1,3-beta-glucanosyltransferase GAS1
LNAGTIGQTTSVKAAARDIKAYLKSQSCRAIPVGHMAADYASFRQQLAEYLTCNAGADDIIDVFGQKPYGWCGPSSCHESGYNIMNSDFSELPIPIFIAEEDCNQVQPRTFEDQPSVCGSNMIDDWSGAIIYEWPEEGNNYGLVTFPDSSLSGTPTTLTDFDNLKSQWATLTASGV